MYLCILFYVKYFLFWLKNSTDALGWNGKKWGGVIIKESVGVIFFSVLSTVFFFPSLLVQIACSLLTVIKKSDQFNLLN